MVIARRGKTRPLEADFSASILLLVAIMANRVPTSAIRSLAKWFKRDPRVIKLAIQRANLPLRPHYNVYEIGLIAMVIHGRPCAIGYD